MFPYCFMLCFVKNFGHLVHFCTRAPLPQGRKTMHWANISRGPVCKTLLPPHHSLQRKYGKGKWTWKRKWKWSMFYGNICSKVNVVLAMFNTNTNSAYVCVWCRAGIHRNGFSITTSSRSPITDYYHCTMPPNTRPTTPTSSNPLKADDQVRLPPFYFSLEDSLTILILCAWTPKLSFGSHSDYLIINHRIQKNSFIILAFWHISI